MINYFNQIIKDFFEGLAKFGSLPKNVVDIFTNPMNVIALLGCAILIGVFAASRKIKFDAKLIARIALALALATILQALKLYHFPQGGSVTPGSMIPIILVGLIYGPSVGLLTGFLYGLINLLTDPYIVHPVQLLFDYPLAFTALGLSGFFKNSKALGSSTKLLACIVAIFGRFLCHFISGVVFFGEYAPAGTSVWIYSLTVNGLIMGAEAIICIIILYFLPVERLVKQASLSSY
ncbi:proton-coupled thiamine transporter YuaJ [Clostridium zeae]|uniref:Proton-coupled thiamine transporter YuaJ n=1 Tax=Clostridium zeae TaxID=2759022 RepID=A0ABQ1EHG5_9CLOT|nr:energy-coupled thiamine transporter ThiT [Clostridium zeae]GFZ34131.1 proton-coupled thiamine transporter YuaJ [Clostridium zeae]